MYLRLGSNYLFLDYIKGGLQQEYTSLNNSSC